MTVALVPGGESAVTVTSDAPLATEAVAAALDEAGAYHLAGSATTPVRSALALSDPAAQRDPAPSSGDRGEPHGSE